MAKETYRVRRMERAGWNSDGYPLEVGKARSIGKNDTNWPTDRQVEDAIGPCAHPYAAWYQAVEDSPYISVHKFTTHMHIWKPLDAYKLETLKAEMHWQDEYQALHLGATALKGFPKLAKAMEKAAREHEASARRALKKDVSLRLRTRQTFCGLELPFSDDYYKSNPPYKGPPTRSPAFHFFDIPYDEGVCPKCAELANAHDRRP